MKPTAIEKEKHKHVYSLQTGMCECGKSFEFPKTKSDKSLEAIIEKEFKKYGEFKGVVTMKKLTYQIAQKYAKEAEERGMMKAYGIFLKTIRDAKRKFPHSKEFVIEVDVRDIEKSLKELKQK